MGFLTWPPDRFNPPFTPESDMRSTHESQLRISRAIANGVPAAALATLCLQAT